MTDCAVRNNGPTYGCSTTIMAQGSYYGRLLKEGTSDELVNDPDVRAKYLGEDFHM